jgi:uncharacterized protein (TIGR00251 family)
MIFLAPHKKGVTIDVHLQPRSAKNKICGIHGDALKLKLTSPPVGGAANQQCLAFLSKVLNIPRSRMDIIAGQKSRQKRVLVCPSHHQSTQDLQREITHVITSFL